MSKDDHGQYFSDYRDLQGDNYPMLHTTRYTLSSFILCRYLIIFPSPFIEPKAPKKLISGCVPNSLFAYSDPEIHFCSNDLINNPLNSCNNREEYPLHYLSCHECSGHLCRDALGNLFKRTCPSESNLCYLAEGYDKQIERGCWVDNVTESQLCLDHPDWCHRCTGNYCNDGQAHLYLRSCRDTGNVEPCDANPSYAYFDGYEDEDTPEMMLLSRQGPHPFGKKPKKPSVLVQPDLPEIVEFSCYQCNSGIFLDQSCDQDVRYLHPTACAYLYGSRPSSCYILIHRGWQTLERGCANQLDKYTYASCDTDLFAECKICSTSGCNKQDMTGILGIKKVYNPDPDEVIDNN